MKVKVIRHGKSAIHEREFNVALVRSCGPLDEFPGAVLIKLNSGHRAIYEGELFCDNVVGIEVYIRKHLSGEVLAI